MKNRIAILLVSAFVLGLGLSACQPKSQCKRYKKKQKKRVRMSDNRITNDAVYAEFAKEYYS